MSQAGEARRQATNLARRLGFDATQTGRASIVASELSTNLAKHATGGEMILRPLAGGTFNLLEVLSLDRGPGIKDVGRCLADGYSTEGSSGTGLGAVVRLSACFDILTIPGVGTAILARLDQRRAPGFPTSWPEHGAVSVPALGETENGDAWAIREAPRGRIIAVIDGLGHGPAAAIASREAVKVFTNLTHPTPATVIGACHRALADTRGAQMAVAEFDWVQNLVRFSGVGNVAATLVFPGGTKGMVSLNGTVGAEVRAIREFIYPLPAGAGEGDALLVMHSDGLSSRWNLDGYPGLAARHPSLIAGVLYRDFGKRHDDVTVWVGRARGKAPK